jgi:putative aldouronate transport system substrate-binding protein
MQRTKKWGTHLIVFTLLLALLAACSSGKANINPVNEGKATTLPNATDNTSTDNATANGFKNGKYDPPITVTRVMGTIDTKFKNGEDWNNNIFNKWAKDRLGINVKTLWVVNSQNAGFDTKLKLSLASGEELPDILAFRGDKQVLNMLIDSGNFMPVDELFNKYADDIYKQASEKWPSMWYAASKDGKKYGFPILDYSLNAPPVMWIREDWLQKLNMQAPKTIDELEKVMDAFVHQNPDGKKDVFGMTATLRDNMNTWMSSLDWLFGAYGTIPRQWNLDANGQLAFGSTSPGAKQALVKLREWMDKGYLSKEAGTWDETKASEQFTSGKAGIIFGPHWMPDWPLPSLSENDKNALYKAYPVPAGPDGKIGVRDNPGGAPYQGWVLINKKAKNPEAYLMYYNYMLEHFANPKAGEEFENGFAEGYDWKMVDGKASRDNKDNDLVNPLAYSFNWEGARVPDLMINALAKVATQEPQSPFEQQTKQFRKKQEIEAAPILIQYEKQHQIYPDIFDGAFTPTQTSKGDLLKQMEVDAFTKIIYGKESVDMFDSFVQKWKSAGGDQMTKEVNDWYKSVNP